MRAILGIGSNVEPRRNVESACRRLARDARLEALSRPWWTPAVGSDGPPFLNCVAIVDTPMAAVALRRWLRAVEREHGRVRSRDRNAPRTLDVDVLATETSGRWRFQADLDAEPYNLLPLADLWPDFPLPDGRTAKEHAAENPLPAAFPVDAGAGFGMALPAAAPAAPAGPGGPGGPAGSLPMR